MLLKLHYNSTRSHRPMLQLKWQVSRIGTVPRRWDPWDSGQPRAHLPAENIWLNLEHGHGSPAERKMAMVIGRPLLKLNASRRGPRFIAQPNRLCALGKSALLFLNAALPGMASQGAR
jgi:hypothetical protein